MMINISFSFCSYTNFLRNTFYKYKKIETKRETQLARSKKRRSLCFDVEGERRSKEEEDEIKDEVKYLFTV